MSLAARLKDGVIFAVLCSGEMRPGWSLSRNQAIRKSEEDGSDGVGNLGRVVRTTKGALSVQMLDGGLMVDSGGVQLAARPE